MTPAQIKRRIAYWQRQLGLGGWDISYSPLAPDPDSLATTNPHVITRSAVLRIHPKAPEGQVERLIVHELAHVLFAEMTDLFERSKGAHQEEAQGFLDGQWHRSEEWVCERLASALTGIDPVEFLDDQPDHWKTATLCR